MNNMEHIKPGDRVLVGHHPFDKIATVERATKTQIILRDGSRFRRDDGGEVGASRWNPAFITNISDDDILRITHRDAITKAGAILTTRDAGGTNSARLDAYRAQLLEAKNIIDEVLGGTERA